jgi:hypothetical protein
MHDEEKDTAPFSLFPFASFHLSSFLKENQKFTTFALIGI